MQLHIIYTESRTILSKKTYKSWREIQDDFQDYKSSLGPWSAEEMADYVNGQYGVEPDAMTQITALADSPLLLADVLFRPDSAGIKSAPVHKRRP